MFCFGVDVLFIYFSCEIIELVDDAIYYADKRSVGHFVDILVGKRYDDQDMIILREKDFMH